MLFSLYACCSIWRNGHCSPLYHFTYHPCRTHGQMRPVTHSLKSTQLNQQFTITVSTRYAPFSFHKHFPPTNGDTRRSTSSTTLAQQYFSYINKLSTIVQLHIKCRTATPQESLKEPIKFDTILPAFLKAFKYLYEI